MGAKDAKIKAAAWAVIAAYSNGSYNLAEKIHELENALNGADNSRDPDYIGPYGRGVDPNDR